MSSDSVIRVEGLGKCYNIYERPDDRLRQMIVPRMQRLLGRPARNWYREFWALRDVSFEVTRGKSVGILGRNGSGKSTLLQMICGTLAPTLGRVETRGRVAALLELGSGFSPEFSGRENVYLNGALLGLGKEQIDERFDSIAAFADIGPFIDQPIKTYSSGMLVRLAFAVQVEVQPDILVVDEALAVGDALFQKRCFQRIEKLVSDGVTLLFVSHDIESIRTLTHSAILLHQGRMIESGTSSTVVLRYRRLLHDEEAGYFENMARAAEQHAREHRADKPSPEQETTAAEPEPHGPVVTEVNAMPASGSSAPRSDKLSFGDGSAEILGVRVLDEDGGPCSVFSPGQTITIEVHGRARTDIDRLNVGIRLRNKEGIKIYSWGTLNQDMIRLDGNDPAGQASVFWQRHFAAGAEFSVRLQAPCRLGQNLYEVQASISHEQTPDYLNQRMLHWLDEAAFFQVIVRKDEHFFGGVIDLEMKADWNYAD